jgi:hypothetical protein
MQLREETELDGASKSFVKSSEDASLIAILFHETELRTYRDLRSRRAHSTALAPARSGDVCSMSILEVS